MRQNGFYEQLDAMMADPGFATDPSVRDTKLKAFRAAMKAAPIDADFQAQLKAKLDADYPGQSMRFRTSTNSEDLDGVPLRGLLLVHHNFPNEKANGVAVTSNPFDATGLDPAFYVNVQYGGDAEVVSPRRA